MVRLSSFFRLPDNVYWFFKHFSGTWMKEKLTPLDGWIVFLAGAFLLIFSNILFLAAFQIFKGTDEAGGEIGLLDHLIPLFAGEIAILLVAALTIFRKRISFGEFLFQHPAPVRVYIITLCGTFGAGMMADELSSLMKEILPSFLDWGAIEQIVKLIREGSSLDFLVSVFVLCFTAGFSEEFVFRGVIFTGFRQKLGPLATILLTSLLFAILHFDAVQGAGVFVLGLFLGYLREKTGCLTLCVAAHAFNNLLSALIVRFLIGPMEEFPPWEFSLPQLFSGALILALSLAGLSLTGKAGRKDHRKYGDEY